MIQNPQSPKSDPLTKIGDWWPDLFSNSDAWGWTRHCISKTR